MGNDWGFGFHVLLCVLLSEGDLVEGVYCEVVDRLECICVKVYLVCAYFFYGEWLRGERWRFDAWWQLFIVHELFVVIGMEVFAERVVCELLVMGVFAHMFVV